MEKNSEKDLNIDEIVTDEKIDILAPYIANRILERYQDKNYKRRFEYWLKKKKGDDNGN